VPSVYVELPQTGHAFAMFFSELSSAARADLHDVDRFLAVMASGWERPTPAPPEGARAALAAR
jgi:hypothetical protein